MSHVAYQRILSYTLWAKVGIRAVGCKPRPQQVYIKLSVALITTAVCLHVCSLIVKQFQEEKIFPLVIFAARNAAVCLSVCLSVIAVC